MVNCAVFGCYNHSKKKPGDENASDVGFFSIPKVIVNQCKRTKDVTQRRRADSDASIEKTRMARQPNTACAVNIPFPVSFQNLCNIKDVGFCCLPC